MLVFQWRQERVTHGRERYSLWAASPRHGEFRVCAYELPPGWPISKVWALVKRDALLINDFAELHARLAAKRRGRR